MKKKYILILTFFLTSCGLKEAGEYLRNQKTTTTDEFLVEKKDPLVIPPEFDKIPEPGSLKNREKNEDQKIKEILQAPTNTTETTKSTTEESILKKIRK
jgi:hypothetical protein|tara:strand:+ start:148 stop:444 length:297 start_codon:yes stop_codon:yes gene_type:complete